MQQMRDIYPSSAPSRWLSTEVRTSVEEWQ